MSVKTQTINPLSAESTPRLRNGETAKRRNGETTTAVAPSPLRPLTPSPPMLSPADQEWLTEQLARLDSWEDDDDDELPESATLDEAIELFLADKCSLGRAAELAGVTRWHLQDILYERGTPASLGSDLTLAEIDDMVDMVEERYGYRE